jgi:hypothetical protein
MEKAKELAKNRVTGGGFDGANFEDILDPESLNQSDMAYIVLDGNL